MSEDRELLQRWVRNAEEVLFDVKSNPGEYEEIIVQIGDINGIYEYYVLNHILSKRCAFRLLMKEDELFTSMQSIAKSLEDKDPTSNTIVIEENEDTRRALEFANEWVNVFKSTQMEFKEMKNAIEAIMIARSRIQRVLLLLEDRTI